MCVWGGGEVGQWCSLAELWLCVPVHAILLPQGDECSGVVLCQSSEQTNIKPSLPETESGHDT